MTQAPARQYAGQSAAVRTARRREALLDAAITVIAESGWRSLRIEGVCKAAGLNKRYFYEAFPDVEALTAAVIDHFTTTVLDAILPLIDPARPLPDLIRVAVAQLVDMIAADPRAAKAMFSEASGNEVAVRYRLLAMHRLADAVIEQGRRIDPAIAADGPFTSVAASVLVGGTIQALLDWTDGHLELDRDQFEAHLTDVWRIAADGILAHAAAIRR